MSVLAPDRRALGGYPGAASVGDYVVVLKNARKVQVFRGRRDAFHGSVSAQAQRNDEETQ